jgi:benzoyl-CoA reductase/2-hydroxyglutaryl-CoA dehydratase subunit BcrC/BadD/HgdB
MFDRAFKDTITQRTFREGLELKEQGQKVIGVYCAFTPKEIIAAAQAIPVALCAGSQEPIAEAENHLPRNLCPLIKSSYGFALTDRCPYLHEADFIFADATCDGKKKMFELLGRIKPIHLLNLPQTSRGQNSLNYWLSELYGMKQVMEQVSGNKITTVALDRQIQLYNDCRRAIIEIYDLNKGPSPLLYGREIQAITEEASGFECHLGNRVARMRAAAAKVRNRAGDARFVAELSAKPRILLTGCPSTNNKVMDIIEESGGLVVAMENCGGLKTASFAVRQDKDPMLALAKKYLATACPCMTPNTARLDLIRTIAADFRIQGVVELSWEACHTYHVEAYLVKELVTEELGLPYIQIRTDYSPHDSAQIKLRIEAFIELI